jgi:hypothetical protein
VDDRLQDVSVPAGRHRFEEAATHDLAALLDTRRPEDCARAFDDVGQIEEDPTRVGMSGQDDRKQCPVSAANVDDYPNSAKS